MRGRIRFSLRTLMLLTLAAAFGMLVASRKEPWPFWMHVPVVAEDEGWADFKFSPDESKLLVWSQNYMQVWDVSSKTLLGTYTPPLVMTDCDWVGEWGIAFASLDGQLRVWNLKASALSEYPKRAVPNMYQQIEASADGTRVMLFPGKRNGAELWDLRTGRIRAEYSGERFAGFSLDGRHYLIRNGTDTLEVHDSEDGKCVATFTRPQRVLLEEGWTWESGFIRTAEVEFVNGGVEVLPTGEEVKIVEQKFWRVHLQFRDGKLEEVAREFNVGIAKAEPTYEVMTKHSRHRTAPDGRVSRGTTVDLGEHSVQLPNSEALLSGTLDRSAFSPQASYVACSQRGATPQRISVWHNRRPEPWWGIVWLPECWMLIVSLIATSCSFYRDIKSHAIRPKTAGINESSVSAAIAPPAKAV